MPGYFDGLDVRAGNARIASKTLDDYARGLGRGSLGGQRIVVTLAENIQPAQFDPAARQPVGESAYGVQTYAEKAEENHQHPLAAAYAEGRERTTSGRPEQDLEQPQSAPHDQKQRPVLGQIIQQLHLRKNVAGQEQDADADQQQRRNQGSSSHTFLAPWSF